MREEVYHWSDVCEGLPYAVTLAFIDMILPFARRCGLYESFCREYDLWEIHPTVSEPYHRILKDRYYAEVFPTMVISGKVYFPIAPQNYW